MSLVQLRIELPTYAHSFIIQVPISCNILDVKQEISRECPGGPRVEGQRLICRGRYLVDHEKVEDIWKTPDEPRIVHLAVHPSAWSSTPPETSPQTPQVPRAPIDFMENEPQPSRPINSFLPQRPINPQTLPVAPHPLAFVLFKHQNAIQALTSGQVTPPAPNDGLEISRTWAVRVVERHGWSWPAILDEEFPAAAEGGLKYEHATLEGQPYLSLIESTEKPTALQMHALKVLSYTFTLLSLPLSQPTITRVAPSQTMPIPPHVNMLLQQLGLPQLRVAQNHNQNPNQNAALPELRQMPLRPLLAPVLMLVFRTLLLLYFVAPARKPIFGIFILAWMLYEIWQPIRNGLIRGWRRALAEDRLRVNGGARQNQNPGQDAQPGAQPPTNPGGNAATRVDNQAAAVLDNLANLNIQAEEQILNQSPGTPVAPPSFSHKVVTFLGLIVTTIHPAVWNRRRVALRQREGRVRTEANAREAPLLPDNAEGDEAAQNESRRQVHAQLRADHAVRPEWLQNYMERVVAADWVDDSD